MYIFNYEERLPSNYNLYFLGDEHIGNEDTSYKSIEEMVRRIKSKKNAYWITGGDQMEAISPNDRRFSVAKHTGKYKLLSDQRDAFIEYFEPIASKGLWILEGNHIVPHENVTNPNKDIAKALDMDFGSVMCKANMGDFKVLDWHGYGSINSKAGDHTQIYNNDVVKIKRALRFKAQDCLVNIMHHIHKLRIGKPVEELIMYDDNGEPKQGYSESTKIPIGDGDNYYIREEKRWFASSGAFLRAFAIGDSGYAERHGYDPVEMSFVKMVVKNDKMIELQEERL